MITRAALLVAGASFLLAGSAAGQIYLSGVVSYGADASGGSITEPAEYDNIIGTGNFEVNLNGQARGTVFLLSPGVNNFTYSGVGSNYNALSLYFAGTGDPFSRPFASTPDLVTFGRTLPLTPEAGTQVQTNGQFSGTKAYSGATSFAIGDLTVSVSGFVAAGGSGTFQLTVTPAPSALGLLGAAGLLGSRRRVRA